ncbi:hypothetical protein AKJ37_04460 [candidate division MSBL1 archaeon SCGC-AAA259I09]|uniref:Nitroreductase domain-containing protein n=3 Tax=candidate division MSBL1 TaxID=215777 RepID=A0A133URA4_9EURY|nr:hypothetical protein AKJ62_03370 [candidate division MSBL1 archaeon SCGC-AAA259D14]KXA95486.1 hypothetical protein AKJ36_00455 [candidate division MSBL1 archaeon SCGC-AAA259I07]KXA96774.1 hypothetical protein AKJ37_04460 [candidate division MSBL1 archaeon SCGC-AAA259I09]
MDVSKAIKERRSVRNFKPDPVPEKDLLKILDAGRWAPSSGNTQPLELIVVKEPKTKEKLAKAARGQSFVSEAPVVIVVCANIPRTERRYGERGRNLYVIQDTAAAAQNIHLMAYALGYATCWVGSFHDDMVAEVIEAPEKIRPLAIIPLGKPKKIPKTPSRRDLENIIHENKF